MKKVLGICMLSILFVLVGCGAKKETTTFTQTPMTGASASIIVEHAGDKVTKVSAKVVFDNQTLGITDEESANQVAQAFETSSNLQDTKLTYSEKETVITYEAPAEYVKSGSSYEEAAKSLKEIGFTEE